MIEFLLYLAVVCLVYAALLIIYRLTLHPVAKFPGPKIAAATKWFEFYHDCLKDGGGLFSYEIDRMHEKYGTVIQIPQSLHTIPGLLSKSFRD